jgi:hypothetical protein
MIHMSPLLSADFDEAETEFRLKYQNYDPANGGGGCAAELGEDKREEIALGL